MGSGWGLSEKSHYYVHAKTYKDLADRVELAAFVEPNMDRAGFAVEKWGVKNYLYLHDALDAIKPTIVSLCTPPDQRSALIEQCADHGVKGIWCEKPYENTYRHPRCQIQVNYCRRFDRFHTTIKGILKDSTFSRLVFMGKKDVHTACHITDLARWWNIDKLDYLDTPGEPGAYMLRANIKGKVWFEQFFPSGGLAGDEFMKVALGNLLDAVEGKAELISPPENAIKSEEWANQILGVA